MNKQPERSVPQEIQDLMPERKKMNNNKLVDHKDLGFNQALTEVEAVLPQMLALAEKRGAEERDKEWNKAIQVKSQSEIYINPDRVLELTQPNHEH